MGVPLLDRLSHRDRRALLLGLAVLLPALLWIVALRPYREALVEARTRLESERSLLLREEALLASAPTLPVALAAAEAEAKRAEMRLVRAPNPPLGEAEVTSYLEDVAGLSRVLLQEMRGVEPDRGSVVPDGVRPVRLAVQGESDLEGVLTFLHRIEESPLLLRIVELSVEPVVRRPRPEPRRRGNDDDDDDDDEPSPPEQISQGVMQFALIVEAYAPPEAAQTTSQPQEVSS